MLDYQAYRRDAGLEEAGRLLRGRFPCQEPLAARYLALSGVAALRARGAKAVELSSVKSQLVGTPPVTIWG